MKRMIVIAGLVVTTAAAYCGESRVPNKSGIQDFSDTQHIGASKENRRMARGIRASVINSELNYIRYEMPKFKDTDFSVAKNLYGQHLEAKIEETQNEIIPESMEHSLKHQVKLKTLHDLREKLSSSESLAQFTQYLEDASMMAQRE